MLSIAAVLKWEVSKVKAAVEESAFYSGCAFTTLSGLQHMELFIGEFFLRSLSYCITIDFIVPQVPQPVLLRKASVLTSCLRNACLAVKARFWNFNKSNHRAFSSSSVL